MKNSILLVSLSLLPLVAVGQHEHHKGMNMPMKGKATADSARPMNHSMHGNMGEAHPGMAMDSSSNDAMAMPNYGLTMDPAMGGTSMRGMSHSLSRNLPMNRNGSGTSWHPDNTPMYAYMSQPSNNGWNYMLHYAIYLRYTSQNFNNTDKRGRGQQFGVPNWFMGMAQRNVGKRGLFQVRAMISLDALTVGPGGYPLLFQTGESYKGQPLIDKQHPHDLFSELSVSYSHAFSKDMDLFGYVGYPGEPAMGPPAFMHRISTFNNPDAPLSHHWQDATHILFGVATAGFRYKWAKVEASSFTGREPNEYRYNFDRPTFDSYSYRLSVNPSPSLALQFSQGFIHSPEDLHPEEDVTRTTASVLHSKGLGPDSYITSALVWGRNSHDGEGDNSFLAESSWQMNRTAVYGRVENITKSAEELGLTPSDRDFPYNGPDHLTINSLTLGMNHRLAQVYNTDFVLGAQLTGAVPAKALQPIYGNMPLSGEIYLRLSPSLMTMRSMNHSGHGGMKGMGRMKGMRH